MLTEMSSGRTEPGKSLESLAPTLTFTEQTEAFWTHQANAPVSSRMIFQDGTQGPLETIPCMMRVAQVTPF